MLASQKAKTNASSPWGLIGFSSFLFFIFFRFGIALRLSGNFDERCYLSWVEKLVGVIQTGCTESAHPPGIAVIWFPAALLGKMIAEFTRESAEAWIAALCGLQSFFHWVATLFLLKSMLRKTQSALSDRLAILLVLTVPVLFFSATRSLLVHSAELLLCTLIVDQLLKHHLLMALLNGLLLCLVRPSDFPYLFPIWAAFYQTKPFKKMLPLMNIFLLVTTLGVGYIALLKGHHSTYLIFLLKNFDWYQFVLIFLRTDFGIVWTQPVLIGWAIFLFRKRKQLDLVGQQAAASACILFFIALIWPTHGSSFGYRYLIGVYPLALLTLLKLDFNMDTLWNSIGLRLLFFYQAIWLLLLYWVAPASAGLWPWRDVNYQGIFPPYGVILKWLQSFGEFISLSKFSPLGYWLARGRGETVTFTLMDQTLDYALPGGIGIFFNFLTLIFLFLLLASGYFLFHPRRRSRKN